MKSGNPTRVASPFRGRHTGRPNLAIIATFAPWMALFAVFTLAPSVATIPISFTNLNGFPGVPMDWIGLENFEVFFSPARWQDTGAVLFRTLIFCAIVSAFVIFGAMGIALILNLRLWGTNVWRAILFFPTILGVTVTGLTWTLVLNPNAGPVASVLQALGIQSALLGDRNVAFWLVIFIQIWSSIGYATVIYVAGLQAIPEELYEAAAVDGANDWQRFRNVTFPLLAPTMTVNSLLAVTGSLQSYQLIYVLTNAKFSTSVLASVVFEAGFVGSSTNQGCAAAVSVVQFVVVLLVTLAIYFPLRRREARLEG
jgi:ABC-type sugar transport system permease subunit